MDVFFKSYCMLVGIGIALIFAAVLILSGCNENPQKTAKKRIIAHTNVPMKMDHQDIVFVPIESLDTFVEANKEREIIAMASVALANESTDANPTDGFMIVLKKLPAEKK